MDPLNWKSRLQMARTLPNLPRATKEGSKPSRCVGVIIFPLPWLDFHLKVGNKTSLPLIHSPFPSLVRSLSFPTVSTSRHAERLGSISRIRNPLRSLIPRVGVASRQGLQIPPIGHRRSTNRQLTRGTISRGLTLTSKLRSEIIVARTNSVEPCPRQSLWSGDRARNCCYATKFSHVCASRVTVLCVVAYLASRRGSRDSQCSNLSNVSNEDVGPLNFSAHPRVRQRRTSNFLELPGKHFSLVKYRSEGPPVIFLGSSGLLVRRDRRKGNGRKSVNSIVELDLL